MNLPVHALAEITATRTVTKYQKISAQYDFQACCVRRVFVSNGQR